MATIGFIGLGNMGGGMAANLVKAGHRVTVFDLSEQAMARLAEQGATPAQSVEQAVQEAEVVISMLPAGEHVTGLYITREGLLDKMQPGTLVIDSSTIDADTAREVAQAAAQRGLRFLDAPVSGGTAGAAAGTLTFIVGGDAATMDAARPILAAMGKNIFHAGDSGAGQVAKACNNMLLGILMAGTSEALALGKAHGLDPKVLSDIMANSSGSNWTLACYNPMPGVMEKAPASNGYQGGFLVDLMVKDLGLAQSAAQQSHSSIPLGSLVHNLFNLHASQGNGQLDFSSIMGQYLGNKDA